MEALTSQGERKVTPGIHHGMIFPFKGSAVPDGFALCDGTNGTPDLRDRFIIGDTAIGFGTAAGTVSATAALTHSGAAVGNHSAHVVTQPSAHSAHVVTQPGDHSNHAVTQADAHPDHASGGAHTHDTHATGTATAGARTVIADNFTHSSDGAHAHDAHSAHVNAALDAHSSHSAADLDAHSAHSGAALDAHSVHSVTQPSSHAIAKHFVLAFIMYIHV